MKIEKIPFIGVISAVVLVIGITMVFTILNETPTRALLRKNTGVNTKISTYIEEALQFHAINIESVEPSHDPITEGMDPHYAAYDLMAADGNKYLLIVKADGKDYSAILDSNHEIVEGIIGDLTLPKFFEIDGNAIEDKSMVKAVGIDGTEGWIYHKEVRIYPPPNTKEEALERQRQNEMDYPEGYKYINLYEGDGKTVIGKVKVQVDS